MARKVTIAAFERWIEDEANVARVLEMISGGMTLRNAAMTVKQPYTCLHPWFHSTEERRARYDGARKAWADFVQDESMALVDGVKPERGAVAKAKLQAETRQNQAAAYAPERWSQRVQVDRNVTVGVDAALIGTVGELLKLSAAKRMPAVVDVEPVEALPAPVAK